jgi:hypothetical protein
MAETTARVCIPTLYTTTQPYYYLDQTQKGIGGV